MAHSTTDPSLAHFPNNAGTLAHLSRTHSLSEAHLLFSKYVADRAIAVEVDEQTSSRVEKEGEEARGHN